MPSRESFDYHQPFSISEVIERLLKEPAVQSALKHCFAEEYDQRPIIERALQLVLQRNQSTDGLSLAQKNSILNHVSGETVAAIINHRGLGDIYMYHQLNKSTQKKK